jgi:L-amino acid N-acyltransferase YncA
MAVHIRVARDSDLEAMVAIYRPIVEGTAISFETVPPDREEMARRVGETLRSYPWLVCDIGGQIAGYAYASRHRLRAAYQWSVDASVYVDTKYRRCGVGRGLYLSLFGILATQGFFNAYAGIVLPNPASVALHESLGFEGLGVYRRVGYKLGAWRDVGWWQRILRAHEQSPKAPRDLATVRRQSEWDTLLTRGESVIRTDAASVPSQ